ncbi:hypothetical protein GA0061098_1007282 [Bradyrhizobium shewense]|uniref:Uncharacterized protein n=1 Tax=Bradyrhizobium shewense TaxID=1761772 RepID=A0A1C3WEG8_9BRAD|nr:hypothetical protein GA0061098_1007282 [Bradyrhizobium shewense]
MLLLAWGNRPFFGFALRAERPDILRGMDEARKAPRSASIISIRRGRGDDSFQPDPGTAPNQTTLVRGYYACRLLARCAVAEFLAQLAQVTIKLGAHRVHPAAREGCRA